MPDKEFVDLSRDGKFCQLLRVLDGIPEDLFHMRAVCEIAECGTAMCLAGWAAQDAWFRQYTNIAHILPFKLEDFGPNGFFTRIGFTSSRDHNQLALLADLFEIDFTEAEKLFGADITYSASEHAVTKDEVRWNIRALMRGAPPLFYRVTNKNVSIYAGAVRNEGFNSDFNEDNDLIEDEDYDPEDYDEE